MPQLQVPATRPYPYQINPIQNSPSHLLNSNFNITLSSTPRSSKWSLSIGPHRNPVGNSPVPPTCHMPRRPHSSNPFSTVSLFSQLTSSTPTKSNLNLTNSLITSPLQALHIPRAKSHVYFPPLASCPRISPTPTTCEMLPNNVIC